jgi:DNA polymerase-1
MTKVAVYTEDRLFMDVQELLVALLKVHPEIEEFIEWNEVIPRDTPTLVLGNLPEIVPARYVKTLSQKQIVTNPAAITEIEVALSNLLAPPVFPSMEYRVVSSLSAAEEARLGTYLVVDIETGGRFDVAIRPEEKYLLSVGLYDGGRTVYVFREESLRAHTAGQEQLRRILTKRGRKLIAHNMKFDFPILGLHLGIPGLHGHIDTMLMHHSINHGAKQHDLKNLAHKYLGAPDWESDQHQYVKKSKDFASIPRNVLYKYNAFDVYWTWHLYQYLLNIIRTEPKRLGGVLLHELRMAVFFQQVEQNGVGIDLPYLTELKGKLEASKAQHLTRLQQVTGIENFNPGSPVQVKKWLNSVGYQVSGTAEGVLEGLDIIEGDDFVREFVDELLEYRGDGKMLGTYVDGILNRRRGNIVYPTFLVHGTSTGRLSSRDPNIQNIPRDKTIRRLVVPRASGRTMVQADYSQAELRVMACLSGDAYLQSLFQEDSPDFFDALMPIAYPGIDLATLAPGVKKDLRAKLKGVIYGMSYGRQAPAIAVSLDMAVQEAAKIMSNYFSQAPDLYRWRQEVSEIAVDPDRALVNPFGRMYQAEIVTGRNKQNVINSGLAFLPQSTASDLCVEAAIGVQNELNTGAYGDTMIVATIHDAILADVPDQYVDKYAAMVTRKMAEAGRRVFGDLVVFAADTKAGMSWAEVG